MATDRDKIARLQYITTGATPQDIASEVALYLSGGGRWVQLRMKEHDDSMVEQTAMMLLLPVHACGGVLIIDDRVEVAARVKADGVHLGRGDMPPGEARHMMGDAIIGATANTEEDIKAAMEAGADYIGLGPMRHTTTKKALAPILGIEGYARIMSAVKDAPPVVAIGGITPDDVAAIARTGVHGIAIGGAISHADDPCAATRRFVELTGLFE